MKKILLAFLFLSPLSLTAQTTFQKTYNGLTSDVARCINTTSDGGYIATGWTNDTLNGHHLDLIRLDQYGDLLWARTLGASSSDVGKFVHQTSDGGFVVVGSSHVSGNQDVYVVRTDANGIPLWSKTYGGGFDDVAANAKITQDGGLIITGYCGKTSANSPLLLLLKTDATGNLQWSKSYEWQAQVTTYGVEETSDGSILVTGVSSGYGIPSTGNEAYILKTDSGGNVIWCRTIGGGNNQDEQLNSIKQASNGDYVVAGHTFSFQSTSDPDDLAYVVRTDSAGLVKWSKTYGVPDHATEVSDIYETADGGIALAGHQITWFSGRKPYLLKTDSSGNPLWAKVYGSPEFATEVYSIKQAADLGFIMAGSKQDIPTNLPGMNFLKTDAAGNTGCYDTSVAETAVAVTTVDHLISATASDWGIETVVTTDTFASGSKVVAICFTADVKGIEANNKKLSIYPNPSTGFFRIDASGIMTALDIYNLVGSKIYTATPGSDKATVDLSRMPEGVYIYSLTYKDGETVNGRLVLE